MSRSSMYSPLKRARIDMDDATINDNSDVVDVPSSEVVDASGADGGISESDSHCIASPVVAANESEIVVSSQDWSQSVVRRDPDSLTFPSFTVFAEKESSRNHAPESALAWDVEQSNEAIDDRFIKAEWSDGSSHIKAEKSAVSTAGDAEAKDGTDVETSATAVAPANTSDRKDVMRTTGNGKKLHQTLSLRSNASDESEMILSSQLSDYALPVSVKNINADGGRSTPIVPDVTSTNESLPVARNDTLKRGVPTAISSAEEISDRPTGAQQASLLSLVEARAGLPNNEQYAVGSSSGRGSDRVKREEVQQSSSSGVVGTDFYSNEDSQHSAASDMSGFAAITAAAESVEKMPLGHSLDESEFSHHQQQGIALQASPYLISRKIHAGESVPLMEHFDAVAAEGDYSSKTLASHSSKGLSLNGYPNVEGSIPSYHMHNMNGYAGHGNRSNGASNRSSHGSNNRIVTCNCKKSKCLKMYCDCFRLLQYCKPQCNCKECCNLEQKESERKKAIALITERNPEAFKPRVQELDPINNRKVHLTGCHCRKSSCLKKYCECFTAHVPCGDRCRCIDCKNDSSHYPGYSHNPQYHRHGAVSSGLGNGSMIAGSSSSMALPSLFSQVSSSSSKNQLIATASHGRGVDVATVNGGSASSMLEQETSAFLLSALSSPNVTVDQSTRLSSARRDDRIVHSYRDVPSVISESTNGTMDTIGTNASTSNRSSAGGTYTGSSTLDSCTNLAVGGISFTDDSVAEATSATPSKSRTTSNLCIKSPVRSLLDLAEVVVAKEEDDITMYSNDDGGNVDGRNIDGVVTNSNASSSGVEDDRSIEARALSADINGDTGTKRPHLPPEERPS